MNERFSDTLAEQDVYNLSPFFYFCCCSSNLYDLMKCIDVLKSYLFDIKYTNESIMKDEKFFLFFLSMSKHMINITLDPPLIL